MMMNLFNQNLYKIKIKLVFIFQLTVFIISCEGKPSEWDFIEDFNTKPVGVITNWINEPVIEINPDQKEKEETPIMYGTKDSPFTIYEAQKKPGMEKVWIEGYIVGGFTGSKIGSFTQNTKIARKSNIAIADKQHETNVNAIFPIELPAGKIRNTLNIFENPSNMGKKIIIRGNIEKYYSVPGLKNPKEFMFKKE